MPRVLPPSLIFPVTIYSVPSILAILFISNKPLPPSLLTRVVAPNLGNPFSSIAGS